MQIPRFARDDNPVKVSPMQIAYFAWDDNSVDDNCPNFVQVPALVSVGSIVAGRGARLSTNS
jgi:hypothetical protein